MDKKEYKRQNEQRKKQAQEKTFRERSFGWWKTPSDRFAAFIALFTAVLAIVAYFQLDAMHSTDKAIHNQLEAMKEADRTTRESFSAVQRPFITALGLDYSQQGYGSNTPQYWLFTTHLENSGNTPTKGMTVTSSVSFDIPIVPDTPPDPTDLVKDDENPPMVTDYFVGPRGKIGVDAISLHFKTLDEMAKSRLDFYVYGIARYRDQFSGTEERVTKFCYVVVPFVRNGVADPQNRRLCHHWNCGDKEDCDRDRRSYEADLREVRKSNPNATIVKRPIPLASIIPFFPIPLIKAQ
jgi:hypothetical protein